MHTEAENAPNLLAELEQLQDTVLEQLDQLNRRIEAVLGEYAPAKI